jgi:hypothetical protein
MTTIVELPPPDAFDPTMLDEVERTARHYRARAERSRRVVHTLEARAEQHPAQAEQFWREAHTERREAIRLETLAARHEETAAWLRRRGRRASATREPGPVAPAMAGADR